MSFLEKNTNSKLLRHDANHITKVDAALEAFFKVKASDTIISINPSHSRIKVKLAEMANIESPYNTLIRAGLVSIHNTNKEYVELSCVDKDSTDIRERIEAVE